LSDGKLPKVVSFLLQAAASAPSADNSQPWCFSWDGRSIAGYARRRGGFPVDYHATQLAIGAAAENLSWALARLGGDSTSWRIGPPDTNGEFFRGDLDALNESIPAADLQIWLNRHTNRSPYGMDEVSADILAELVACRVGDMHIQPLRGDAIKKTADWVRRASEVRFQTREVNEWFAASLRYGNSQDDWAEGLHVDTLALPPGGVGLLKLMSDWNRLQCLNRLRAYKLFSRIEAANFQKAPLILAVVGNADGSAFDAGRCLQRVWLRLTELGLSAHPYYVVSDLLQRLALKGIPEDCLGQAELLGNQIRSDLGQNLTLHCLLRVGKPARQLPVSGRFPLQKTMCNGNEQSYGASYVQ
jgi:hypothetical protein